MVRREKGVNEEAIGVEGVGGGSADSGGGGGYGSVEEGKGVLGDGLGRGVGAPGKGEKYDVDMAVGRRGGDAGGGECLPSHPWLVC